MRAMWTAFAAMIVISVAAWLTLDQLGFSAAQEGSSPAVRLD